MSKTSVAANQVWANNENILVQMDRTHALKCPKGAFSQNKDKTKKRWKIKTYSSNGGQGLDDNILQNAILHVVQEVIATGIVVEAIERKDEFAALLALASDLALALLRVLAQVGQQQDKERVDDKGFVAVADGLVVDGFLVEPVPQERDDGVDGNHEHDADNVTLLCRLCVFDVFNCR